MQSKTYSVKTNENGEFTLEINLGVGNYPIISTFNGNDKYQATSQETTLTIL